MREMYSRRRDDEPEAPRASEILGINEELLCVYTVEGHYFCKNQEEYLGLIKRGKEFISRRAHPLERWEDWEVTNYAHIPRLLLSRARTNEEKELVRRYQEIGSHQLGQSEAAGNINDSYKKQQGETHDERSNL